MKTCKDYSGAPPCCNRCHDDAEDPYPEYPLCQVYDTSGASTEVIAEVCCIVAEYVIEGFKDL